jgi:hypothetical protein
VTLSRVGRAIDVKHLQLNQFTRLEAIAANLSCGTWRIVGLIRFDAGTRSRPYIILASSLPKKSHRVFLFLVNGCRTLSEA